MSETILVTGSSRGIGQAIALYLAEKGFDIVVHCRNRRQQAEQTVSAVEAIGQKARLLQFDIVDRDQCRQILLDDIERHGAYYGVVCNAGVSDDAAFPAMTGEQWKRVMQTNLDGFYNVLQPVIMPMIQRRKPGRIITLSSVSGLIGNRGQVNYSAAKAGVIGASKALALELAKRKITVNCVAPGLIETDMVEHAPIEEIKNMIPAKRIGTAKEVAAAIAFLMSEEAAYITRQVIAVNGGLC